MSAGLVAAAVVVGADVGAVVATRVVDAVVCPSAAEQTKPTATADLATAQLRFRSIRLTLVNELKHHA